MRYCFRNLVTLRCPTVNPRAHYSVCLRRYKCGHPPCPIGWLFWHLPTRTQKWYLRRALAEFGPETVRAAVGWIELTMAQQRQAKRQKRERCCPERVHELSPDLD